MKFCKNYECLDSFPLKIFDEILVSKEKEDVGLKQ